MTHQREAHRSVKRLPWPLVLATCGLMLCSVLGSLRAAPLPLPQLSRPLPHPARQGLGVWSAAALGYPVSEYLICGRANV